MERIEVFGLTYAGGVALPLYEGQQPQGSAAVPGTLIDLPGGGAWDYQGAETSRPRWETITIKGEWIAASSTAMQTKLDELKALTGQRSYLWASSDGGTTNRFRLARCLHVRSLLVPGNTAYAIIEMDWQLAPGLWNGAAHAETTVIDAASHAVSTTNGGNATVRDAVITVTAKVATITLVSFYVAGILHWHYKGTIGINKLLVVNCGTKAVTNDGANDYVNFELQAEHAQADWNPIAAGANTYTVDTTSASHASHEVKLDYWDGWQ